jgi:hypothetical protein
MTGGAVELEIRRHDMKIRMLVAVLAACCWLALCGVASATELQDDEAALAKTVQNPIANLVTLPFQYNYNGGVGPYDRNALNLNVQPLIPFPGEKWNIITRTIIPLNSVPVGEDGSVFGFGDISLSLFWSPAKSANLSWGVGPALKLPTASDPEILGAGKLAIGPTGVLFYKIGKFTMGGLASNVWSVTGDDDREDVNFFFMQYFVNFNLGQGWALGTAPIVTCDWTEPSGEQWAIPWGLQLSKVTHLGKQPANLLAGYYYYSEQPTNGPENQIRLQVNLMYP